MKRLTLMAALFTLLCLAPSAGAFECGDLDNNGHNDIGDIVQLVTFMFQDGDPLFYPPAADCDGNGAIDIADVVCWVQWMFQGSQTVPACPFVSWTNEEQFNSGCMGESSNRRDDVPLAKTAGTLRLEVDGDDLLVFHDGAYYQCCLEYEVEFLVGVDNVITGFEFDVGELCDCYCPFDLSSTVFDLPAGEYTVVLIGIEGDTVGIETAIIGEGPYLLGYGDSGCLSEIKDGDPNISYTYDNGTLTMQHNDAYFNCGAVIEADFESAADTLRFYELNVSDTAMWCNCYFDVWATVAGIEPGDYVVELYQQEFPDYPIVLRDRRPLSLR